MKMVEFPTYEEMGKKVAEKALDEILHDGKSIREWMQIIVSEDCVSRQAAIDEIINLWADKPFGNPTLVEIKDCIEKLSPVTPQPCEDAISRQVVLAEMYKRKENGDAITAGFIKNLPPVTPAEKVGRWIARGLVDSNGNRIYECSECHHSDTQAATMIVPYCWYCGAKMEGEE